MFPVPSDLRATPMCSVGLSDVLCEQRAVGRDGLFWHQRH